MLAIPVLFYLKILTRRNLFIQVYITFPAQVEEKQRERGRERKRGGGEQEGKTQGRGSAEDSGGGSHRVTENAAACETDSSGEVAKRTHMSDVKQQSIKKVPWRVNVRGGFFRL